MIIEKIITTINQLVFYYAFSIFPDFSYPDFFEYGWLATLTDILRGASYFLPVGTILTVMKFSISLDLVRLAIAVIVRLKSFIPTMGA